MFVEITNAKKDTHTHAIIAAEENLMHFMQARAFRDGQNPPTMDANDGDSMCKSASPDQARGLGVSLREETGKIICGSICADRGPIWVEFGSIVVDSGPCLVHFSVILVDFG